MAGRKTIKTDSTVAVADAGQKPARTSRKAGAVTESATPVADVLQPQAEDESSVAYLTRLALNPTAEAVTLMRAATLVADDSNRLRTFEGRVETSQLAGLTLVAEATVLNGGVRPTKYPDAARLVGVTDQNGLQYLGRSFSTLKECWSISSHHTDTRMAEFVSSWHEAHGVNPESVRAYSVWVVAEAKGGKTAAANTTATLKARKDAAAKTAAKAKDAAEVKRQRAKRLTTAVDTATDSKSKPVAGCTLTLAQWQSFSEETLTEIETLASALRLRKAEARREAEAAKRKADAASETGPTATATPRVTVQG